MKRPLAVLALGMSSLCCAHGPKVEVPLPPSSREFHTAPEGMKAVKKILCNGTVIGLGTAHSASAIVTAYHVIEPCTTIQYLDRMGKTGALIMLRYSKKEDWAVLGTQTGDTFDFWATVNMNEPPNGERLWSYLFLPGGQIFPVSGLYIGLDNGGDGHTLGTSHPGSSGSGVFNGAGELVGIVGGNYGGGQNVNRTLYGSLIRRAFKN